MKEMNNLIREVNIKSILHSNVKFNKNPCIGIEGFTMSMNELSNKGFSFKGHEMQPIQGDILLTQ